VTLVRANRNSEQGSREEPGPGSGPRPRRLLLAYLEPDYLGEGKRQVSLRAACVDPDRVAAVLAKLTNQGSIVDVTEQREDVLSFINARTPANRTAVERAKEQKPTGRALRGHP